MGRFLIFGSVGWDRPIWLDQPLKTGGRLLGLIETSETPDLPAGRLGGAASNAAACLTNAGHEVAVWSQLRSDDSGEQIRSRLIALGVETSFLQQGPAVEGATLILIDPDGERTILFQHSDRNLDATVRAQLKHKAARIDLDKVQLYQPDGVYLRSLFSNFEDLERLEDTCIVTHWPQRGMSSSLPADVLIGSRDDLEAAGLLESIFEKAQQVCGERLKGVIVTNGKAGGEIIRAEGCHTYTSRPVEQVDATGAGDSFAAGVLEALIAGADIVEAAHHGARWGATTASLKGCAEPRAPMTYRQWSMQRDL